MSTKGTGELSVPSFLSIDMMKLIYIFPLITFLFNYSTNAQITNIEVKGTIITCLTESLEFFPDSSLKHCELAEATEIQNLHCIGLVEFYKNGNLKICTLEKPALIQNIAIKSGIEHPVYFFENGKLKQFTLNENTSLFNVRYKKNTRLEIDLKGKVKIID